jgi:hypothetical protein
LSRGLALLLLGCALILPAPARAADPLMMFLLGFAQNLLQSSMESRQKAPRAPAVAPVTPSQSIVYSKPPAQMDAQDLQALVDESFLHLTRAQRAELLAGLEKTLADPASAGERDLILTQFVNVARQFQFSHGRLARLSAQEKQALANQFALNYRRLNPEQQQLLREQLHLRALPLPDDLSDMMLAALDGSR